MEYLIWLVLAVAIGATFWWKSRQVVTKQDWEKNIQSTEYRQDTFLTRTSDKDELREGIMRSSEKAVPVPPPMRDGRGRPVAVNRTPSAISRVDAVGNTASPPQTVGLTPNSNIADSSTNMLTNLLVLDALGVFDDKTPKSSDVSPTECGRGEIRSEETYKCEPAPSYTPSESYKSDDSGWSGSSGSSSWGSDSDSSSSSSSSSSSDW